MTDPTVAVRINSAEAFKVARSLSFFASDQLPFALAAALTDTAREARDLARERLGRHFKLRNRALVQAIHYLPASKRDKQPAAAVVVRPWAEFLAEHAIGAHRVPRRRAIAIPTRIVRRTASGRVPSSLKPRALGQRKGFDPREFEEKARVVVHRPGKLGIYYLLRHGVRIKATWPIVAEVHELVRARFAINFQKRAHQALATRRAH